jgi:hypothetical protein
MILVLDLQSKKNLGHLGIRDKLPRLGVPCYERGGFLNYTCSPSFATPVLFQGDKNKLRLNVDKGGLLIRITTFSLQFSRSKAKADCLVARVRNCNDTKTA